MGKGIMEEEKTDLTVAEKNADGVYRYQDNDDKQIQVMKSDNPHWEKSEARILARMKKHIAKHAGANARLLDAGCGQGRLLPVFAGLFGSVTAVEPDVERFQVSRKTVAASGLGSKVDLRNIRINDLDTDASYDVILCSHVLQHVTTDTFDEIIGKFRAVIKPSGLLLLTLSHSTIDHEYFEVVKTGVKENEWDIVSKQIFNDAQQSKDLLPVRHFTLDNIKGHLPDFEVIDYRVFHIFPSLPFLESIINHYPSLQMVHGTDMFVAVKFKG